MIKLRNNQQDKRQKKQENAILTRTISI